MIVSFLLYMYTPIYTTSSQRVATYLDIPSLEGTEGTCVQGRVLLGPPTGGQGTKFLFPRSLRFSISLHHNCSIKNNS